MIIEPVTATKVYLGNSVAFTTSLSVERVELEARYVASLYQMKRKVEAIKHARNVFGTGLKEAKYFCEQAHKEARYVDAY